jgi:hypothetical protein
VGFALKLHADLDKVKWVSGNAGDDRSYAAFDESFETHYVMDLY